MACRVSYIVISNLIHEREILFHVPTGLHYWLRAIGIHPIDYPLLVPLWYVRTLLIFVAASPLLIRFAKSAGVCFVLYVISVVCTFLFPQGWIREFESKVLPISGLFYFCFGLYLSRQHGNSPRLSRRIAAFLLCGGILVVAIKSCLAYFYGWHHDQNFRLLFIPPIMAGAWTLLPALKMPVWISRLSFPIYLLHGPVMFVGGLFFAWNTEKMLGWWAKYVFALVCSALVCWVMKRFFPRVASIAFGGRL